MFRFKNSRKNGKTKKSGVSGAESKLNAMMSNISDVVGVIDDQGVIRYNSPNITSLFGWSLDKVIGETAWKFVHPDDLPLVQEHFVTLIQEQCSSCKFKFRLKCENGEYVAAELSAVNMFHDPEIGGILYNYHSIEVWERKERELKESEERFKALHNASFGGIAIHDKGIILDFNKGLSEMSGYSAEELSGMNGLLLIAAQSRDFVLSQIQTGVEKPYEALGLRKNGETFPLRIEARNIPYKGKQVRVVEFRDISEQKKADEEIQRKNQELAESLERIQKINAELAEAKERAEESDRLKTAFLCNLSHEIRTPMNGILGFAQLLDEEDLDVQNQRLYIELIQESGQRMLNLINDLVDISQIETGQVKISEQKVNLNQLLERLYEFFRPVSEKQNLKLTLTKDLADNKSFIVTDKNRLEQVISNLLSNALKFTHEGSVGFGYKCENEQLHFWVKDTGPGIEAEMQEIIFQRFRQVDDTMFREQEGSGLGLAISKSIVELMGGEIRVESSTDSGSVFEFYIPFNRANGEIDAHPTLKHIRVADRGIKVLVAEDNEMNFLYLNEILKSENTTILRAYNGVEATEQLNSNPDTDIILMDLKMPVMNGLEATRRIREINSEIPIIAQTAYASESDREDALNAGCNDLVAKPIRRDILIKSMHHYLRIS